MKKNEDNFDKFITQSILILPIIGFWDSLVAFRETVHVKEIF